MIADAPGIQFIEGRVWPDALPLHCRRPSSQRRGGAGLPESRNGAGDSASFLSVIFPHNQMQILPYNRVLKDLNGLSPAQLLEKLAGVF